MENKKTAVDWIFLMLNNPNRDQRFAKKLLDKAKEIEKEQIMDAYSFGWLNGCADKNPSEEFYYEENYGK